MTHSLHDERKKLLYRAMHRGFKEADLLIGRFAKQHLEEMNEADLASFSRLLDVPDQELYGWIIGRTPAPSEYQSEILTRLQQFDVASTIRR